ncbi:MAG: nitronate monooxygenase [Roseiflexaceae bacterium]
MIDLAPHNPYGLTLRQPVLTAAGCFGYSVEYARLADIAGIGAIITRSTTLHRRRVTQPPQLIETPAGLLAVGAWPNPGLARVIERHTPVWAGWDTPVLLSVAGTTIDEFAAFAAALEGVEGIAGLELNLAGHTETAARIVAATRAASQLPLLAKLPYLAGNRQALAELARSVADAGADAVVAIGSPRGMAADPQSGEQVEGWLSGPALRPLALALIADLTAAVSVPVIGCGGIASVEDARQFLAAGAVAIQIGAALLSDPGAAARIGMQLAGKTAEPLND